LVVNSGAAASITNNQEPESSKAGETVVMTVKRTITCDGGLFGGRALTQMLNEEDVRVVDWDAPREVERRGIDFSTDAQQVVVTLVAMGAPAAIKAAVEKFHKRFPRANVEIQGEATDDGGFPDE
jgi:hypothetical protein